MDIRVEALIAAFVPSLFFLVLVYTRDRFEREPKLLIVKLYVMSVLAVAIAAVLELASHVTLQGSTGVIVLSAAGVGLIEEGSIFAIMVLGTRRTAHFNEPVDGMVYASAVALGFAAIETLTYIIRAYDQAVGQAITTTQAAHLAIVVVAPARAITGNLGHMAFSGIVGYAYARRRLGTGSRAGVLGAYAGAAALHGAYDGFLALNAPVLAYTVLIGSLALYVHLFRHALAASPFRYHRLRWVPPRPPAPPLSPAPFVATDVVPPPGMAVWAQPHPASHVVASLPGGTHVHRLRRLGDWALVLVPEGWSGWVDARALVPVSPQGLSTRA